MDPQHHKTRIDLRDPLRRKIVEPLAVRLADAIDLALQARQGHRNVNGPQLAARLTAFGGTAEGTAQVVAKRRSLEPYPLAIGAAHRETLATALATFACRARGDRHRRRPR